ncbi:MAG: phosphoglucosamine mutase [Patescibacteria group bacterium]
MQEKKKLNVSGYRGVWGQTLTEEIARGYARAFALFTKEITGKEKPTILVGRDGRASGSEIKEIIIPELEKIGASVVYGDVMPTPTVLFAVRKHGYDGAIIITASHNPIEYNGLKFVNNKALFTIEDEVSKIESYYESARSSAFGSIAQAGEPSIAIRQQADMRADKNTASRAETPNFSKEHADKIITNINVSAIRAKKFKVAVDMINASACVMDPYLFEQLGVELIPLNNTPNGQFAHTPEPLKQNLTGIAELVKTSGADLGFAHDPDADRLLIINELGEVISEEYTVAFGIENILSKNSGKNIVINLSTSQMSADIGKKYSSKTFRTKIGEGYVVDGILAHDAIIGGEGNGGCIYPAINTCRDSFTSLALVLEILAERNQTVSECVATLPKYFMKKDKWSLAGLNTPLSEMYEKLKSEFNDTIIDEQDGLRLDFPDSSWIHIRPSNTEPIIRIFGEAKAQEQIDKLFKQTKLTLGLQ